MLPEDQQIRFTRLWTDAQPIVSQYVASLIRDHWAVRDIVQNTSLALLRKFGEYDASRPFLPWAMGVAKFEILGHQRDVARNRLISDSEFLDQYTKAWAELAPQLNEKSDALRHCVGELGGRSKTIIQLRYGQSKSSDAISKEVGLTAANVRTILKRTRDGLRQCVKKRLGLLGGSA